MQSAITGATCFDKGPNVFRFPNYLYFKNRISPLQLGSPEQMFTKNVLSPQGV